MDENYTSGSAGARALRLQDALDRAGLPSKVTMRPGKVARITCAVEDLERFVEAAHASHR